MTDTKKEGGAEWEAGEAWKLIVKARAEGDSDAEQLGWTRYKEALTNAAGATAAAVLIVLDGKIDRLIAQSDNAARASLDWRSGLREHLDARFDNFGAELDGLRRLAADGAARLGKLESGQERISEEIREVDTRHGGQWEQAMTLIGESQEDRRIIHQELAALKKQLTGYIAGSKRDEVAELKRRIAQLEQDRGDGNA